MFTPLEWFVLFTAVVTLLAVLAPEDTPEPPKGNGEYENPSGV